MFHRATYTVLRSNFCIGNGYRFSFNGQEKDDEVAGVGNSLDFKYRGYNPRLGRFFAVDPLTKKFPELSCYQFAGNTPIWARELEGLEPWYSTMGIPQNTLSQSNAPLTMMTANVIAYGPYSLEYAANNNLSPRSSMALNGIDVTPNGAYPSPSTIRNNDYAPYIPTPQDVYGAADAIGDAGDYLQYVAPLTGPFAPEVAALGAVMEVGGEVVKTFVDIDQQGLQQGAINGSIRAVGIVIGEGVGAGMKQLTKQGGEALGEGLKIPINAGIDAAIDGLTKPDSTETKP